MMNKNIKCYLQPRGFGENMFRKYIRKGKCNHAVGFCCDMIGWLHYEDFILYMSNRIYKSYSRHTAFDYCPLCGKNLKKIQAQILKIKENWFKCEVLEDD